LSTESRDAVEDTEDTEPDLLRDGWNGWNGWDGWDGWDGWGGKALETGTSDDDGTFVSTWVIVEPGYWCMWILIVAFPKTGGNKYMPLLLKECWCCCSRNERELSPKLDDEEGPLVTVVEVVYPRFIGL